MTPKLHGGTLATLVFVALAAAMAGYLWTQPTVIQGEAAAATLFELVKDKGANPVRADCDPATPVGNHGARVECSLYFEHDDVMHFELSYLPDGRVHGSRISRRVRTP